MAITNAKALAVYIKDEYRKATGGQEISPIRLQKALYFCFAYWGGFVRKGKNAKQLSEVDLDQVDEILFDDQIEAWVYGPVIPNVYKADKEGTLEKNRLLIEELFKDINIKNYILLFNTGILIASSTIIPGISSTVLLSMIGMYGIYINAINTINITILFPIIMGFLVGGFILSKIITKLLNKYYGYTYFAILGFTISTIPALIKTKLVLDQNLIIGLILAIIAFYLTKISLNIKTTNNW